MDIKNTLELVEALNTLGTCLRAAKEDGDVDIWDTPKFAPMLSAAQRALKDASEVKQEIQELDEAEVQELVDKLFAAVTNLADAVLSK